MVIALTYLSVYHLHRAYVFKEAQTVDISAPLMILTQKMTSLAFAVHDGAMRRKREPQQSEEHADSHKTAASERYVEQRPTFTEFFSYTFHFSGVICGPLIFIDDYLRWTRELDDENDRKLFFSSLINPYFPEIEQSLFLENLMPNFGVLRPDFNSFDAFFN